MKYRLTGGAVFDPANGIDGDVMDVWVHDGKIAPTPRSDEYGDFVRIDCSGRVIMPGGVDIHSHIAGPKVNVARRMQPELSLNLKARSVEPKHVSSESGSASSNKGKSFESDWRVAGNRTVPTIVDTGRKYLGLGYTTAFDAAIAPTAVRATRAELEQLPYLDAGYYLLLGNHHFVLQAAKQRDTKAVCRFVEWVLHRCGGYAVKLVNPGGVENFKRSRDGNAKDLDERIDGFEGASPRIVIEMLAAAADELGLPHPVHIHCNNLGLAGNWRTTLETMRALGGRRGHFAHIQFHSYGGSGESEAAFCSQVQPLAAFVNAHPEITLDVGQILFGKTTSMTGDNALGYYLSRLKGQKYYSCDTEVESGCGISPIEYKQKNFVHSMQWAIGLEWFLSVKNPWQISLSTDHPNGASFLAYPQIIRLLMDASFRRERLREVNPRVLKHSSLADMTREYGLGEIAIITRAGPARALGLSKKGHLGIGADEDVTVYNRDTNYELMFQFPWLVMKAGQVVISDGELRIGYQSDLGTILELPLDADRRRDVEFENWIAKHYSFGPAQFGCVRTSSQ